MGGALVEKIPGGRWCVTACAGATVVVWEFDPGVEIPRHNHPHAQISILIEGGIDMHFDDGTISMRPGDPLTIPPEVWHGATLTAPSRIVDVFVPNRLEYEEEYASAAG